MNSIITVSQLNRYAAFKIKEDVKLRGLLIKGEISGFTNHTASGHFYFTLKDNSASIKAVMYNNFASRLKFMPHNGMSVIVMASAQIFERDGLFQIYVTDIYPDGIGAQYLAFEQLKEQLAKEGLFDSVYKKPLPLFPSKIGIVTARTGAALQDILNILRRRYPLCEAVVFPCLVQGEYAPASVCEALRLADSCGCDVIICGRGGGSYEDLSAFNSEMIARTVFAMNTPVISAVGHETDTTIIDYVSDLRAPTPSAAAELAVPELYTLISTVENYRKKLEHAFSAYISKKKQNLVLKEAALKSYYPSASLAASREKISALEEKLESAIKTYFERKRTVLAQRASELDALSPLKIMARGYSLTYKSDTLIKSSAELSSGDKISLNFFDGEVNAVVCEE